MLSKKMMIIVVGSVSLAASANEEKKWGADISLSTQHQEYEIISADMNSLSISPYFKKDNWLFTVSVPWMQIDGDYFVNGNVPRVVNFCQRVDKASPQRLQRLVERGRITQKQLDRCNAFTDVLSEREESQSGLGDINLAAEYVYYWGQSESWWTSIGIGYKHDNGDVEKAIGSGSRDSNLDLGIGYEGIKWFSHLDYSFVSVSATKTPFAVDDYSGLAAGVGYNLLDNLSLGIDYQKEEAYLQTGEDIDYWSSYLHWLVTDNWSLILSASDYDSGVEYPESEYGMQISYSF